MTVSGVPGFAEEASKRCYENLTNEKNIPKTQGETVAQQKGT